MPILLSVAVIQSISSMLNTIRTVSIRDGVGGKKAIMVSLMLPLPPLPPLMNHPMLIIVFAKGTKSRLQALGKYGVR